MAGSTLRNLAALGVSLAVLAPGALGAQGPPRHGGASGEEGVVVIPRDWRETYPFTARFPDTSWAEHVIDLAAARFATDRLVTLAGRKTFRDPDLATFAPSQVRQPFALGKRDLFIVQATDPAAQVTLRRFLQRARIPVLEYVPHEAYLVRLDSRMYSLLSAQGAVFWIGLFQPAYRVAPDLDFILQADPAHELKLRVRLDAEELASEDDVRAALGTLRDARVAAVARSDRGWIARVDGPVALARTLAALPGCLWVERFRDIHLDNNVARTSASVPTGRGAVDGPIMDVEDVWARGLHGEGQVAAASDTGLSTGNTASIHADFGNGAAGNPVRVTGYAVNDRSSWNDDYSIGGGHGTHTSGSIVGNGIQSGATPSANDFPAASYAGIAPKADFVFQSIMQSGGTPGMPNLDVPPGLDALFQQAYDAGARVHSNSWGTDAAGAYDELSRAVDAFAWTHPDMVITFSAGNSGGDGVTSCVPTGQPLDGVIDSGSVGSPATAKNCIAVGASENYRPDFVFQIDSIDTCDPLLSDQTTWGMGSWGMCDYPLDPITSDKISDNAAGLAAFSSRGPTLDLRIKPDLVAPGAAITSTRTDVNPGGGFEQWGECEIPAPQQAYYLNMGGTSMANPLTAGAATLVRQYYADGWHANNSDVTNAAPVLGDRFNPSAALVKATLINGAWDMAPGQYGGESPQPEIPPLWDRDAGRDLPNDAEGYGRVDVEGSLFPHAGFGRSAARLMDVHDVGTGLATTDKGTYSYGVGSSSDSLVATLVWTDPYAAAFAETTLVNDLDLEVTSPSGRRYTANRVNAHGASFVHDTANNVEQVKVTAPETGQWTVEVVGTSVPGNGVGGSDAQPYALVFSAVTCAVPAAPFGLQAVANGNNRIDLDWSGDALAEYRVYRGTAPGEATTLVGTVTGLSFADATVSGGSTYYYVVKTASAPECESAASAEVSATAGGVCTLLPAFAGLGSATAGSASCAVDLLWAAATASCGGPVTYSVYRSTTHLFVPGPGNRIQAGLATTSFTDMSGLDQGTTYYYVVRATDEANGAEETNTVERSAKPAGKYLYGPEDFEAAVEGTYAGWTRAVFTGSEANWRGVQDCGGKVFRYGGAGCLDEYAPSAGAYDLTLARPPAIAVPPGATNVTLSFSHQWQFEPFYDGAYLAVSLDGTTYTQVPASAFVANPYNGSTVWTLGNPVWDGDTLSPVVETVVDLDAACDAVAGNTGGCAGKSVFVAFTAVTDWFPNGALGWFIDNVKVTADVAGECALAPQPVPFFTARSTSGTNLLEWKNPAGGGYGSAVVRVRTDGTFPTSATDGAPVSCPGQDTTAGAHNACSHEGLADGTTYSYSLFVASAGLYSPPRTAAARPFDTSGAHKWAYSTGASSLAAPGVLPGGIGTGAVFALSNDRALHAMDPTALGGSWPRTGGFSWTPAVMNAPAQHRPPVVQMADKTRVFLASQDGHAYAVDAATGALLWTSDKLGDVLQANPAGFFSALRPGSPDLLFVGTRNASSANTLYALDPASGATVTSFDNGGGPPIGIITGIAVDYLTARVYFTSRGAGGGSPDTLWCLAWTGSSLGYVWSLDVGDVDGSPVLHGGRIYVGTNAGEVKAIDPAGPTVKWTYSTGDDAVKGYVAPQFGSTPLRLFFSTTTQVWAIDAGDTSAAFAWSVATIPGPSTPLFVPGSTALLVGSSNGALYQLSTGGAVTGSLSLGTGGLGSPARDAVNELVHVGSTAGVLHTVALPLP